MRASRQERVLQGARFKVMCADAGLTIEATAKALHVTARTVRYWFSGKVGIPYAAYRLVRILGRFELPDPAWRGWVFHSGKLWSPEGHGFVPADSAWWGLLVRRARLFDQMVQRQHALDALLLRAGRTEPDRPAAEASGPAPAGQAWDWPTDAVGRAAQPPGLNLFIDHFGTEHGLARVPSRSPTLADANKEQAQPAAAAKLPGHSVPRLSRLPGDNGSPLAGGQPAMRPVPGSRVTAAQTPSFPASK